MPAAQQPVMAAMQPKDYELKFPALLPIGTRQRAARPGGRGRHLRRRHSGAGRRDGRS